MFKRKKARELARFCVEGSDPKGCFEVLYTAAGRDAASIPWADLLPNANRVKWFDRNPFGARGKKTRMLQRLFPVDPPIRSGYRNLIG